jgi:signal transduction histidine kinase
MTDEDRHRILKPYARGSKADTRNARGVGLGLAVCYHVVRAHQGRIEIESLPGEGSLFSVVMPAG